MPHNESGLGVIGEFEKRRLITAADALQMTKIKCSLIYVLPEQLLPWF